jgi:putative two-component system response regulator
MTSVSYEGKMYEPSIRRITAGNTIAGIVISLDDVTSKFEYKALQDSYMEELKSEVAKQTRYASQRQKKVEEMSVQLVQTLANAIDAKDKYTNGHSSRVAEYCVRVATAMGWDKEAVDLLRYEGLLHDIGKIGISDNILNKAEGLTDTEFSVLKEHVTIGGDIMHDASTLPGAENVIRHHHERYDGKGYPNGLKGEQIPLDARIVTIVDTYDAMSSNRVYRKALPKDVIKKEMLKERGGQFDPQILDIFLALFDRGSLDDVAPRDNGWFDDEQDNSPQKKKSYSRLRNNRSIRKS